MPISTQQAECEQKKKTKEASNQPNDSLINQVSSFNLLSSIKSYLNDRLESSMVSVNNVSTKNNKGINKKQNVSDQTNHNIIIL